MKRYQDTIVVACLAILTGFGISPVSAQVAPRESEITGDASFAEVSQAISSDPAFDRYVSLSELGEAWRTHDAAALTDAALEIAEGERVLMRPHAQLPAEKLLSVAAKLALEKKDRETLARLKRAAEVHGKPALAAQLAATSKLGGAARSDAGFHVSVEDTSPEEYRTFRDYLDRIRSARIGGDGAALAALETEIKSRVELPQVGRDFLLLQIKQTATNLPKQDKPDETIAALDRLSGASRGLFEDATGYRTPEPIRKIAPNGLSYTPRTSETSFDEPPVYDTCQLKNATDRPFYYTLHNGSRATKLTLGPNSQRSVTLPASLSYDNGLGQTKSGKLNAGRTYRFYRSLDGSIGVTHY